IFKVIRQYLELPQRAQNLRLLGNFVNIADFYKRGENSQTTKKTCTVIVLSLLHISFIFNHNFIQNLVELFASWGSEIVCDGFQQFETKTASAHHGLLKKS